MNDYIVEINEYPLTCFLSFNTQWWKTRLFGSIDQVFRHGFYMPCRGARRDNHRIRERTLSTDVNDVYIFGFEILQCGDNQRTNLFGEMNSLILFTQYSAKLL